MEETIKNQSQTLWKEEPVWGGGSGAGLSPQVPSATSSPLLSSEEKEKSWLETAIVQRLNTFPRAWTQPIYFNSTEAFHGEKKKTYAWPNTWNTISISVASNIIPHNGTSSLCWGSATHSTLRHLLWNTRDYNKGKDYKWRDDEAGFYSSNIPW